MVDNQVIVLYANLDDKPVGDESQGWVSIFLDNLKRLLKRLSGRDYTFINLNEYDLEPDTFPIKSSVILPLFSNNLLQAPIFTSYLSVLESEIKKKKKGSPKFRFLNVFKNRIDLDEIPAYLKEFKMHKFYSVDSLTDYVSEISYFNEPDKDHNYWMKLFDVALDIKTSFEKMGSPIAKAEKLIKDMKPLGIYIAQSGLDQEIERENLYRELLRNDFKIYQLDSVEKSYEDLEKIINEKLSKCQMSVHLVGEDSGALIKDRGLSILEIENQLASEHSRQINDHPGIKYTDRFNRVIWLSPSTDNLSVKQRVFIENLKKDFTIIQNAEILEFPIESLKNFILNKISSSDSTISSRSVFVKEKKKSIYFICDKSEKKQCKPIGSFLEELGYKVVFSNFEGELIQIRDFHNRNLQDCDGTLIFYGNNNENWVKSKLFDSVKALGLGREKLKNPTAVIVDSDKKVDLDLYFDKEGLILFDKESIDKDSFKPFLNQLEES